MGDTGGSVVGECYLHSCFPDTGGVVSGGGMERAVFTVTINVCFY